MNILSGPRSRDINLAAVYIYIQDHLCCFTSKVDQRNNISLVSCYAFIPLANSPSIHTHIHIYICIYTTIQKVHVQWSKWMFNDIHARNRVHAWICSCTHLSMYHVCDYQRKSHHWHWNEPATSRIDMINYVHFI